MSDDDAIIVVGERRAGSPLAEEATRSKRARDGGDARDGSHPPADPPLFRLFTSRSGDLSRPGGNAGCVSLPDIVSGPVRWCVVMNFMIDLPWLLSPDGCPSLNDVPTVVWVADERNAPRAAFDAMRRGRDWRVVYPQTPKFGTHHTKCFILVYDAGCRVCVHTSNLIELDVHRRANAAWTQDFPLKSRADRDARSARSLSSSTTCSGTFGGSGGGTPRRTARSSAPERSRGSTSGAPGRSSSRPSPVGGAAASCRAGATRRRDARSTAARSHARSKTPPWRASSRASARPASDGSRRWRTVSAAVGWRWTAATASRPSGRRNRQRGLSLAPATSWARRARCSSCGRRWRRCASVTSGTSPAAPSRA